MTSGIESAGDAALGAVISRAVEPAAGDHDPHRANSETCLNCGTRLIGSHCHQCGQNGHVHRTVGAIGHDIAHGVFHFEGKIWRTLPMLAFKPGVLTRRYVDGERARFVSPLAIFLFSVFLMFAIVAQLPLVHVGNGDWLKPGLHGGIAQAREKVIEERRHAEQGIADLRKSLAKERTDTPPDAERIARLEKRITEARQFRIDLMQAEAILPNPEDDSDFSDLKDVPWLGTKVREVFANPKLLLYKLKTSAYKYSWALIPISLPFIWLLFPFRRNVGMYDHAVFATYSLAFMSLLMIVLAILVALGLPGGVALLAAMIIIPIHIYKQLKYGYGLSRIGALWRTMWMVGFAITALVFFALMLLGLGVAG